jgi:hypothetical protein
MRRQPLDVLAVIAWLTWFEATRVACSGVKSEHLVQDDAERPAIQQQVVKAEQEMRALRARPHQMQTQRNACGEVEASLALRHHQCVESSSELCLGHAEPIVSLDRETNLSADTLHRLYQPLPQERGA